MDQRKDVKAEDLEKAVDTEESEAEETKETETNEEEGEVMEKEATKSEDLTEDDLQKSLDKLAEVAKSNDPVDRKKELLIKAQETELDKSEQDELFQLIGGPTTESDTELADEVSKGMEENETLQKALDVSDFLREQSDEIVKSMSTVANHVEKSDARQHEFNLILAKAVADIGKLTKSIDDRLGSLEMQPARKPKSKGVVPLEKSFAGEQSTEQQLTKSMVLDTFSQMIQESVSKGLGGATENGVDLTVAASKYEQFNQISPELLNEVIAYRKNGSVVH